MQIDLYLKNAIIENIDKKFSVIKGEDFTLVADFKEDFKWFSENDPVLSMKTSGNQAKLNASEIGSSILLILAKQESGEWTTKKELTITVIDKVVPKVVSAEVDLEAIPK